MDPIKAKFYQAGFEIESGGESLSLKGLVSEQGITKIAISKLPPFWEGKIGQAVTVRIDRVSFKAAFLKQFVEHGSFYELRFLELQEPHRNYVRQRIAAEGISPGWQREFPRIPVGSPDPGLPAPSLCLVRFHGKEVFVNVVNFTLGGLRIESAGDDLAELRVGSVIHFDLATSAGVVMPGMSGEVRNLAEQPGKEGGKARTFGLKLVNLDAANAQKYKALIKDYCLAVQKRLTGAKG
jgi:hypothetical protein